LFSLTQRDEFAIRFDSGFFFEFSFRRF